MGALPLCLAHAVLARTTNILNPVNNAKKYRKLTYCSRYDITIMNGAKNPLRSTVLKDLYDSILLSRAGKGTHAKYRNKEEQLKKLTDVYEKYAQIGTVWSAATSKVSILVCCDPALTTQIQAHAEQLKHVEGGCLIRKNQTIASDGSRIEGSHKGWNSIQRSFASGIEVFTALSHDHVLRRNIHVAFTRKTQTSFLESTNGSHHVDFVNYINCIWNKLVKADKTGKMTPLPELPDVKSGESFGLVNSRHVEAYTQLIKVQDEDGETVIPVNDPFDDDSDEILENLHIDPSLRFQPAEPPSSGEGKYEASKMSKVSGIFFPT
jgi:hypothetical protein